MVKKEIIDEAIELTKNIPSTDGNVSENNLGNSTTYVNGYILTPSQQEDDKDLTPYPKTEYKIIEAPTMDKLVRDVNTHLANGRVCDGGVQVSSGTVTRFYQSMERRNVDIEPESEMPSQNSEAGTMGPKPLYIPGLEDEPDLYEDIEKDAEQ